MHQIKLKHIILHQGRDECEHANWRLTAATIVGQDTMSVCVFGKEGVSDISDTRDIFCSMERWSRCEHEHASSEHGFKVFPTQQEQRYTTRLV